MIPLGRLDELLELLGASGRGVSIRPIQPGSRMSGVNADHAYAFEGWEVGWITSSGGDELAVGRTVEEAVEGAIATLVSGP